MTWAFLNRQSWGAGGMRGPHHNFVVIAPMIMKFGTGIKLDVFYTMVTEKLVASLLLRNYDVMTSILANAQAQISDARNSQTPSLIRLKFGIRRYFGMLV